MGMEHKPTRARGAGGGFGRKGTLACSDRRPSQYLWRQGPVHGEGGAMAASHLVHHSTTVPCVYGSMGFFHKLSQLWSSLLPSLQAVYLQPTVFPSLGLLSKSHVLAPSTSSHQQTHNSAWGTQSCGMGHQCRSYSVLLVTNHLLLSPVSPRSSLSVPVDRSVPCLFFRTYLAISLTFIPQYWFPKNTSFSQIIIHTRTRAHTHLYTHTHMRKLTAWPISISQDCGPVQKISLKLISPTYLPQVSQYLSSG